MREIALKFFHSFLTDGIQRISISITLGSCNDVIYGVPQGTVLEPILFLIRISNKTTIINRMKVISYVGHIDRKSVV